MTAAARRDQIYQHLSAADAPLSATALAKQYGVSRQIIVGDIALLRAEGRQITATPRGYVIAQSGGLTAQLAVCHNGSETRQELYTMVDCGCTVLDVVVEHPVYGQITAALQLSSRYDVDQFVQSMTDRSALPLSALTEGIHLHTLSGPGDDVLAHLKDKLRAMGVLLEQD
jgi:transcriptional regulator of NAD metabolism